MATVNAQSVEDFADRIVYRFPAGRYEQTPVSWNSMCSPGLKTLVNTDASRSYVVPSSGLSYKFFKIEWLIKTFVVLDTATAPGLKSIVCDFARYSSLAPALNYDGRSLQTEFYEKKSENVYASASLRSINISNIALEPIMHTTDLSTGGSYGFNAFLDWSTSAVTNYLVALLQPTVTAYKK